MKTFTHTQPGPVRFRLDIGPGLVEIHAEDRADTAVTLAPAAPGDKVAAGLIDQAEITSTATDPAVFAVRVPRPAGGVGGVDGAVVVRSGRSVYLSGGTISAGSVVVGADLSAGGVTIVNGRVISGSGVTVIGAGPAGGAVRAAIHVPAGSLVEVNTDAADVTASGGFGQVECRSTSGDVDTLAARVDLLGVVTVSGDVEAGAVCRANLTSTSGDVRLDLAPADDVSVRTVSGDVRITRLRERASVETVSGDITVTAVRDAVVQAKSVSGDIRVDAAVGVRVDARVRSLTGRVRRPRGGA